MQKISLYIQPILTDVNTVQTFQNVDLMEEDLITLTQVIQDAKDLDKIFTDYSKTFNLPASKTNNKLFKHWHNQDVIGVNNQKMLNARIELNHLRFRDGVIKLESVVMKNNRPSLYKVTFFGGNVSFKDLIGEDNLDSLEWLENFDFTASTVNIIDGLKNGFDYTVDSITYSDAVIYPLLAHSQKYIINSTGEFDNFGNITINDANTNTTRGIFPEDIKPAIKVSLILKAIELRYGITFASGGFFENAAITNMYLWLHRQKGKMALGGTWVGNVDAYNCQSSESHCTSLTTDTIDAPTISTAQITKGSFSTSTGVYTIKKIPEIIDQGTSFGNLLQRITELSNQSLKVVMEVTPASGFETVFYDLEIIKGSLGSAVSNATNLTGTQSVQFLIGSHYGNGININDFFTSATLDTLYGRVTSESAFQFSFKITVSEYFDVLYKQLNEGVFNLPNIWHYFYGTHDVSAEFTSNSSNLTPQDGFVQIHEQIPDMKVMDFLKGLFKMHNLTAFVNTSNEIEVKTLDAFYDGGDVLDLTKFIKTDEHSMEGTLPYKEISFKYSEAKTILADEFKELFNRDFGSLKYIGNNDGVGKYEVKAPFEHMMYERIRFAPTQSGFPNTPTDVQYGLFVDADMNPTIGKPLLFYAINQDFDDDIFFGPDFINFVDTVRPLEASTTPTAGTRYNIDKAFLPSNGYNSSSIRFKPTFELHFGSEINSYTYTDYSGDTNSLFNLYYKNYIERVFDVRTRLFKFTAMLPLHILNKLTLDDKIIIGTHAYTINKMTTKLQSGETEFELLNNPS
tara:strand:- start:2407 stop:4791 length:2385 start_codon:yes stop_codon:yes gene_type:complete